MGVKKKEKQSLLLLFVLFLTAAFQVRFSAASHPHSSINVQTRSSPNRVRSSLVFPVQGNVYPNGFFYTTLTIGNPPRQYHLDIDTGSDLTWVQCAAASSAKLLKAPNPPYRPKNNVVLCKDPLCGNQCKPNDQCDYEVKYADYGSSLGVMVKDTFLLKLTNHSVYQPTLAFGCGYDQEFSAPHPPPYVDGVLGLANGKSSIVSQLRSLGLTKNIIGHCFSGRGGGFFFIGDDLVPQKTAWIPMLRDSMNHYSSGPVDLLFDGKNLVAKGLYMVFDSGSTYTYLSSQVYQATLALVKKQLTGKPLNIVADGNLPVCWRGAKPFRSVAEVTNYFRPLVLAFTNANNVPFALPPEAYLIVTNRGNVCLGILDSAEANLGNFNVIGDVSMQDKLLIYDNERQRIGWAPSNCKT